MTMLRQCLFLLLSFACMSSVFAEARSGQTVQIATHFKSIVGSPTWLIVLRDEISGQVFPYLFDIKNNDNYWVASTTGRNYRVTVSTLTFGPYAKIKNFCHIQSGVLQKSIGISLSGDLSPDPHQFRCRVLPY